MQGAIAATWDSEKESKKDQRSSGGLHGKVCNPSQMQIDERKINKTLGACDCYHAKQSDFSANILAMPMPVVGCEEFKTVFTILHCCFFQGHNLFS